MNFEDFEKSSDKLSSLFKLELKKIKTELVEIYSASTDFFEEIKIIGNRIESETQSFVEINNKIFQLMKEKNNVPDELSISGIKQLILLRLDVKCFFIMSRIFLDTLARTIRYFFGSFGHHIPRRMRNLVKNKLLTEMDSEFAEGLKNKLSWIDDFIHKRDEIVHYLGYMVSTTTIDGKYGFDILGLRNTNSWGNKTVSPIITYVEEILLKLSEAILFIHDKFVSL